MPLLSWLMAITEEQGRLVAAGKITADPDTNGSQRSLYELLHCDHNDDGAFSEHASGILFIWTEAGGFAHAG